MKNKSTFRVLRPITDLFVRYNLIIFIIIVVTCLTACVIILGSALSEQQSVVNNNATTSVNTSFDQSTINRLANMTTSDASPTDQTLPSGRINPFAE